MSEHLWRIYRYRNVLTDESYVGQTVKNVNERARNGKAYRKGTKFREAIDKYGWENFEQSILRLCTTQEDADYWEKYFIDKFDCINNGYNTCVGGNGGCFLNRHHTEESRKKISENHADFSGENHWDCSGEKNPMYNRHHTEESRRKVSDSMKEAWSNPEFRQKLSDSKKGKPNCNKGRKWFNNGIKCVRAFECPGDGWERGRS